MSLHTSFLLNEYRPASLIFSFALYFPNLSAFLSLIGASSNTLWLWDLEETALIQLPASYLLHVQSWKVEDWLYFLSWIPFASRAPPALFSWKTVTCRDRQTEIQMHIPTHLFYISYRQIQEPCLVEVPTSKAALKDKLGQLWWRVSEGVENEEDGVILHTGRRPM